MKPIPEHIEELLPDILEGIAGKEQQALWDTWLAEDAANRKWYDEMQLVWQASARETSPLSAEQSWEDLLAKRNRRGGSRMTISYRTLSLAASLLLLLGLGAWYLLMQRRHTVMQFAFTQEKQVALPDGSQVFSPGDALIEYPSGFDGNTREVTQHKGMAFFEVTKNPEKPFIIHSQLADIRVVGTSFRTLVSADSVEVIVATGKVAVYHRQDTVMLLPGEKVVYYADASHSIKTTNTDANYLFWKTAVLAYNDIPLADVLADLQQKLNIQIQYDATQFGSRRLSGRYHADSPDHILSAIAETLELDYRKENNTYILTIK